MNDVCVPIVFTEYKIAVPHAKVDLPKFINKLGIADIETPKKLNDLGHAGCLFIRGADGLSKYYEYGRYDPENKGLTRKQRIPDVTLTKAGRLQWPSLQAVLHTISFKAGQGGVITAAWIAAPGKFAAMLDYAEKRVKENMDKGREPYDLLFNSCNHFMKGVMEAAGLRTPLMVDKRPVSYIKEIRDLYPDLDYTPRTRTLLLDGKKPV